jgi:7-keto-8-aminopelargonate synthetase-like enzyme
VSAVSTYGSRVADLAELSALARAFDATLVADVTHDLGAMGQSGRGVMEIEGCLGRVDVVLGSLGKCFGAPGGFVAFDDPDLGRRMRQRARRGAGLSRVNTAAILAGLALIDSPEGRRRRLRLHGCTLRLRNHFFADGIAAMGQASPIVPVALTALTATEQAALLQSAGPIVPLVTTPLVSPRLPRWRILLNADHGTADIDDLAELVRDVTRTFGRLRSHGLGARV